MATPSSRSEWVSISEAAQILGVSVDTVRRWEKKGILRAQRLDNNDRYFHRQELEEFQASRKLSISEAAARLHVSISTLRRLEEKGLITPDRGEDGKRLYTAAMLAAYQAKKATTPPLFTAPVPPAAAPRDDAAITARAMEQLQTHAKANESGSIKVNAATTSLLGVTLIIGLLLSYNATNSTLALAAFGVTAITAVLLWRLRHYLTSPHSLGTLLLPEAGTAFAQGAPTGQGGEVLISYRTYARLRKRFLGGLSVILVALFLTLVGLRLLPVPTLVLLLPFMSVIALSMAVAFGSLLSLVPAGSRVATLRSLVATDHRAAFAKYAPTESTGALKVGYTTYKKLYRASVVAICLLLALVLTGVGREVYLARQNADQNIAAAVKQFNAVVDAIVSGQGDLRLELQKLAVQSLQPAPTVDESSLTQRIVDQVTASLPAPPEEIVRETSETKVIERTVVQQNTLNTIQLSAGSTFAIKNPHGVTFVSFTSDRTTTFHDGGTVNIQGIWQIDGAQVIATAEELNKTAKLDDTAEGSEGSRLIGTRIANFSNFTPSRNDVEAALAAIDTAFGDAGLTGSFTAGSVLFADSSGAIAQDNASFYWDDTNNRLGIGTTSPSYPLTIQKSSANKFLTGFLDENGAQMGWIETQNTTGNATSRGLVLRTPGATGATGTADNWIIMRFDSVDSRLHFGDTGSAAWIQSGFQRPLHFRASGSTVGDATLAPHLTIANSSGLVGIADSTPDASLEVVNDGSGDSFLVADTNDGDTTPFVIQSDGDVGIGVAAPTSKLHVVNTATATTPIVNITSSFNIGANGLLNLNYGAADSGRALAISDSSPANTGAVLITKTTNTAATNTAIAGLNIIGTYQHSDAGAANSIGRGLILAVTNNTASSGTLTGASITATANTAGATAVGLNVTSASSSGTAYAALFNGGNVGIGTTGPDRSLDVLHATNPQLRLTQADGTIYADFQVDSNGDLLMNVDGVSNQLVLDNGGNVGIGTASPQTPLHIKSSNGLRIERSDNTRYGQFSINSAGGIVYNSQDGSSGIKHDFQNDGVSVMAIRGGNVGIGETSPGSKLAVSGGATVGAGYDTTAAPTNGLIIEGNVGLGTTSFGTDAAKVLAIGNGTAPTTSIADGVQLWAEDVAASSELRVRDEAGNVTTLSPHNFSLFAPQEDYLLPWSFYSKNDGLGREINVDMYGAITAVELLSGQQFIYAKNLQTGEELSQRSFDTPGLLHELQDRVTTLEGQVAGMQTTTSAATADFDFEAAVGKALGELITPDTLAIVADVSERLTALTNRVENLETATQSGRLTIPEERTTARITFATRFAATPNVVVTPLGHRVSHVVTELSATGFTIELLATPGSTTAFSWIATKPTGSASVDFSGSFNEEPLNTPTPSPTPLEARLVDDETASTTGTGSLTGPSASPALTTSPGPSVTPTPSPKPSSSPKPSATPSPTASPAATTSPTPAT